jgi:hypothetical protein
VWAVFPTYGIYFTFSRASPLLAVFGVCNPLVPLVEYERNAFDAGYPINLVSPWRLFVCAAELLPLGWSSQGSKLLTIANSGALSAGFCLLSGTFV